MELSPDDINSGGFEAAFKAAFLKAPHKVIAELEKLRLPDGKRIPIDELKKNLNMGRGLTKSFYKAMTDDDMDAVDFVFWVAYTCERLLQELIIDTETKAGGRRVQITVIVDNLSFTQKITVVQELYAPSRKKDGFISLMRVISGLRNSVAHGRFGDLKYKGYPLSDLKGQLKLTVDLRDVATKAGV